MRCIRQISASIQMSLEDRIEASGFLIHVARPRKAYFWSKQEQPDCRWSKTGALAGVLGSRISLSSSVSCSAGSEIAVGDMKVRKEESHGYLKRENYRANSISFLDIRHWGAWKESSPSTCGVKIWDFILEKCRFGRYDWPEWTLTSELCVFSQCHGQTHGLLWLSCRHVPSCKEPWIPGLVFPLTSDLWGMKII